MWTRNHFGHGSPTSGAGQDPWMCDEPLQVQMSGQHQQLPTSNWQSSVGTNNPGQRGNECPFLRPRFSRQCVVTRAGHALHFCRKCIDQRPVGEPWSGA